MRLLLLLVIAVVGLSGCATIISDKSLSLVDRTASFEDVKKDPQGYAGKYLLVGGAIARVRNTGEEGEIEVVQFKTDDDGKITDTTRSGGRFLAVKSGFVDPAVYKIGLLVTLVGEVQGKKTRRLEQIDYTYPVLLIREVHLWQPGEISAPPAFHFGVGVGAIFH